MSVSSRVPRRASCSTTSRHSSVLSSFGRGLPARDPQCWHLRLQARVISQTTWTGTYRRRSSTVRSRAGRRGVSLTVHLLFSRDVGGVARRRAAASPDARPAGGPRGPAHPPYGESRSVALVLELGDLDLQRLQGSGDVACLLQVLLRLLGDRLHAREIAGRARFLDSYAIQNDDHLILLSCRLGPRVRLGSGGWRSGRSPESQPRFFSSLAISSFRAANEAETSPHSRRCSSACLATAFIRARSPEATASWIAGPYMTCAMTPSFLEPGTLRRLR